jgi:tetratricopeptide (TPR) repeat protein
MRTLALLLALTFVAQAQENEPDKRARAHFEAGRALYSLGNYEEALREFVAGYQIIPRPKFLLNMAQAYRKLDRLEEARKMYLRYLDEETPAEREQARAKVEALVREIDEQLVERAKTGPPQPAVKEAAPPPAATAVQVQSPVVASPQPAVRKKSFVRRHWWIIPTTLVVAAGLAVGIYFAARPTVDCGAAPLGCIDAQGKP